jgi:hypothetical protein
MYMTPTNHCHNYQISRGEQVIVQDITASNGDDNASSLVFNITNSIFEECKDVAWASLSDLDTAIVLFGEVINWRPAPHPLHSDSLKDLAGALATRFTVTNQHHDLD